MAKHKVVFLKAYQATVNTGPLTVITLGTGATEQIDDGREIKLDRKAGEIHSFSRKEDAIKFVAAHPAGTCEYLGKS